MILIILYFVMYLILNNFLFLNGRENKVHVLFQCLYVYFYRSYICYDVMSMRLIYVPFKPAREKNRNKLEFYENIIVCKKCSHRLIRTPGRLQHVFADGLRSHVICFLFRTRVHNPLLHFSGGSYKALTRWAHFTSLPLPLYVFYTVMIILKNTQARQAMSMKLLNSRKRFFVELFQ